MTDKELIEFFRAWARDIRRQHSSSADARTIDYAADRLLTIEALIAENARLREALADIARQKKTLELDTEYEEACADFEEGYDAIIDIARATLTGKEKDND